MSKKCCHLAIIVLIKRQSTGNGFMSREVPLPLLPLVLSLHPSPSSLHTAAQCPGASGSSVTGECRPCLVGVETERLRGQLDEFRGWRGPYAGQRLVFQQPKLFIYSYFECFNPPNPLIVHTH